MRPRHISSTQDLIRDISWSAITAGFVAVLVGIASSAAIVFQAGQVLGATSAEIGSWIGALCLGVGVTSIGLSWTYRTPIVTAWSTPGAAMLVMSAQEVPLSDAIGAFLLSSLLITAAGFTGFFERLSSRIPESLVSAMLGGVLLKFGIDAFEVVSGRLNPSLLMLLAYLLGRRWLTRYAVLLALLVGVTCVGCTGMLRPDLMALQQARPVFTTPTFSPTAIVSVSLPLFILTMTSQNIPGVAAIRTAGYRIPVSRCIGWIGITNALLAPFGAFALNLAAITASICLGIDAHQDRERRYIAAIAAGGFYLFVGLFGASLVTIFAALPHEIIVVIAGLALLGPMGNSVSIAFRREAEREAALITFLITASGISLFGVGSALCGLVVGGAALRLGRGRRTEHLSKR
ncbi:MAG: benzoate/H(+) symporter BenE family transporter [Sinimarinibacterium flocculans]|uniref:benzoate/H(+) symporter BenE family transporter n=1 Tax=Sinimarinibacterium flocculans TaxID=985250 RepID=UPI003C350701